MTIGFNGSSSGIPAAPTNYVLNGASIPGYVPPIGPIEATATFADVNDWGSGFTGNITVANTGSTSIIGWTLSFTFAGTISDIWNATIASHVGNQYVLQNVGYDTTILPGQSLTIGFNASPGHPAAGPSNYVLNGVAIT